MTRNYVIQNVINIPLKTLKAIAENGYRSKDNTEEFCPFEIQARIWELESKKAVEGAKANDKSLNAQESESFDKQLLAVMAADMPHQYLLNLIDAAYREEIVTEQYCNRNFEYVEVYSDVMFDTDETIFIKKSEYFRGESLREWCCDSYYFEKDIKIEFLRELKKRLKRAFNREFGA